MEYIFWTIWPSRYLETYLTNAATNHRKMFRRLLEKMHSLSLHDKQKVFWQIKKNLKDL